MKTTTNEPLRGPKYRSRAFQEYLLSQTPERTAEILAGERAFNETQEVAGSLTQASERDYDDSLHGFEVTPAGPNIRHTDHRGTGVHLRPRT